MNSQETSNGLESEADETFPLTEVRKSSQRAKKYPEFSRDGQSKHKNTERKVRGTRRIGSIDNNRTPQSFTTRSTELKERSSSPINGLNKLSPSQFFYSHSQTHFPPIHAFLHLVNTVKGRPKKLDIERNHVGQKMLNLICRRSSPILGTFTRERMRAVNDVPTPTIRGGDDNQTASDLQRRHKHPYSIDIPEQGNQDWTSEYDEEYETCSNDGGDVEQSVLEEGPHSTFRKRQLQSLISKLGKYMALQQAIPACESLLESIGADINKNQHMLSALESQHKEEERTTSYIHKE